MKYIITFPYSIGVNESLWIGGHQSSLRGYNYVWTYNVPLSWSNWIDSSSPEKRTPNLAISIGGSLLKWKEGAIATKLRGLCQMHPSELIWCLNP